MELTDKQLKNLPNNCVPFNSAGAVIINREILKSITKELLRLRTKELKEVKLAEHSEDDLDG